MWLRFWAKSNIAATVVCQSVGILEMISARGTIAQHSVDIKFQDSLFPFNKIPDRYTAEQQQMCTSRCFWFKPIEVYNLTFKNQLQKVQLSTIPGSICVALDSRLAPQPPSVATWRTACVVNIITKYLRASLGAQRNLPRLRCTDLMSRSWQSSCRSLILSGPRCHVPPTPSHTSRFMASRRALI